MDAGTLGIIGIILGLVTLIILAFKGWGMLPTTIVASLVVVLFNKMDLWTAFQDGYMVSMKNYAGNYMLLFFLGTLFGGLLGKSGAAKSIAMGLLKLPFKRKAIPVTVIACAILSYGGVSLFVLVFTIYPIALVMFQEEDLPKRIFPGCLFFGSATFTMTVLPGTPAVQNLIPTTYFGTNAYAAPVLSLILAAIEIAWGFWWLFMWQDRMKKNGEHFIPGPRDKELVELAVTGDCIDIKGMPNFAISIAPILVVLVFIGVFTKQVENATFAVNLALMMGIISIYALHSKTLVDRIEVLNESAANSIISLLNTAVVVGFGGVVKNCGGFAKIVDIAMNIDMSPLLSGSIGVILISMACGSASGGLSTFLDALGEQYKQLAISQGISLEAMHKIFAIGADALDSLPHSGGYITAIVATDLTHKETYPIFFGTNSLTPIIAWICGLILYMNFGIV